MLDEKGEKREEELKEGEGGKEYQVSKKENKKRED